MILFPAIDLLGGECVRLAKGEKKTATLYNPDPVAQARCFLEQGAQALHIVDLDAAFDGTSDNAIAVEGIVEESRRYGEILVQLGGGLRGQEAVEGWLKRGVARVVLATLALEQPALALSLCRQHRENIAIALDLRDGKPTTRGWAKEHDLDACAWLAPFVERGIGAVIVTDIARDGMLSGSNLELTFSFAQSLPCPVIASGGVASLDDIRAIAQSGLVAGAVCGRALYEKRFSLEEALTAVEQAKGDPRQAR